MKKLNVGNVMKRLFAGTLIATMFLTSVDVMSIAAAVQDTPEVTDVFEFTPGYIVQESDYDVHSVHTPGTINGGMLYAAPVESKYVPESLFPTRNQSEFGTCWAFATTSLVELSMLKKYGSQPDLSEFHLAYFNYHNATDPLNLIGDDENYISPITLFEEDKSGNFAQHGGNYENATQTLLAWRGATAESDYAYIGVNIKEAINKDYAVYRSEAGATYYFNDDDAYNHEVAHVQNVYRVNLETDREEAKKLIKEHGAIGISYYEDNERENYYSSAYNSYYCTNPQKLTNHAIVIVGWDDDFDKTHFTHQAPGNGAWLMKNSWTTVSGYTHRSYFWLSYYDASLTTSAYVIDAVKEGEPEYYDNNYQYDGSTMRAYTSINPRTKLAQVFTTQNAKEELKAVGIEFADVNENVDIEIYKLKQGYTSPEDGTLVSKMKAGNKFEGFYTIPLEQSVYLNRGESYSVIISGKGCNGANLCIGTDATYNYGSGGISVATAHAGEAYYFNSMNWSDYGLSSHHNLRIKAYTNNVSTITTEPVTGITISGGDVVNMEDQLPLKANIAPVNATNRKVTWTSSNNSVATVNSNGVVTPVGVGTVIITAKTADGGYTATHSVEVTNRLKEIRFGMKSASMKEGESKTLSFVAYPSTYQNLTNTDVTWIISDPSIATINANGVVTGIKPGSTVAYASKDGVSSFINIFVRMSGTGEAQTDDSIILNWSIDEAAYANVITLFKMDGKTTSMTKGAAVNSYTIPASEAIANKYTKYSVRGTIKDSYGGNTFDSDAYITYRINYNLNGGTLAAGVSNPSTYDYNTTVTIPNAPTRSGYTFLGWVESDSDTPNKNYSIVRNTTVGNKTLKAVWGATEYHITYDLKGGSLASGVTNPTTYTSQSAAIKLNNPTRTGYTFAGWTGTGITVASTSVTIAAGSTGDRSYVATWTPINYTITYNLNGGAMPSGQSNPTSYNITSAAIKLNNPTRTGYTFVGWTGTGITGANANVTIAAGSTGNRSYVATWTPTNYTITYNLNGGAMPSGQSNPTSYSITSAAISLNNPTRVGYTFAGWTGTGITGASTSVTITAGSTGDRSYVATWTPINYTITYNLNGGEMPSGQSNPTSYNITSAAIKLNNPTRTGYTFAGWTGTGITGASANVTIAAGSTGNRSYVATWTPTNYTITYNLNGGEMPSGQSNPTSYNITSSAISLKNPTRTGYTFAGWTGTGITGASTSVTIAKGSTGNRSYTATWTKVPYTLTYDLCGGTMPSGKSNPTGYDVETNTFTLVNPTRTGYIFAGWQDTTSQVVSQAVTISKGSTGNKSYKATWRLETYSITYDLKGGTVQTVNPTSYTIESGAITLNNPTRTGYTFAGWTGTGVPSALTNVTIAAGSAGNRSYVATWTPINYTITYNLNGGSVSGNPTSYNITSAAITLNNPTKTGYTFVGWQGTGLDRTTLNVTIATGSMENRSYTAIWKLTDYSISYNLAGGSLPAGTSNATTYNMDSATFTLYNPTRAGYTFAGWTGTGLSSATTSVTIATKSTGDRSYTATWTPINYKIIYNLNGGSVSGNPATYNITNGAITLKNPTRSGYTFAGWKGTGISSVTMTVTIAAGSMGDRTYTATWTDKVEQVTSTSHTVNQSSKTVSKITPGTTAAQMKASLSNNELVVVTKSDGKTQVSANDKIGTGMIVKVVQNGQTNATYTVIVTGDNNGDGIINVTDMIKIKAVLLRKESLSGVYSTASDTNGDGVVNITDFIKVKATLLKKDTITPR